MGDDTNERSRFQKCYCADKEVSKEQRRQIVGNALNNSIVGGKDTILNYASGDTLQILDAEGKASSFSNATYSYGTLTLTVENNGDTIYLKNLTTATNININGEAYHVSGKTLDK